MNESIKRSKLLVALLQTTNPYVLVFTKKSGEVRTLKGINTIRSPAKSERLDTDYFVTFDIDKKEYRTVNLATVFVARINKKIYEVV